MAGNKCVMISFMIQTFRQMPLLFFIMKIKWRGGGYVTSEKKYENCVKSFINDCSRVKTVCDGTRAETRFGLPAKRTSSIISAGVSVPSSTGFLAVRVEGERL